MAITVLYVVGKGRSGSTLLDTLLGQEPGVCSLGELAYLWEWGYQGGYRCGCGQTIPACPVWRRVREDLVVRVAQADRDEWARAVVDDVLKWPAVRHTIRAGRGGPVQPELADFIRLFEALYKAIAAVTETSVLVDSSKWPAHPGIARLIPGVDPVIVHLVRDPRGVALSYRVGKETGGDQPTMPRFGAAHSSASWMARNATVELVQRMASGTPSVRLRYEDLIEAPREQLAEVLTTAGVDPVLDHVHGSRAELGPTHTVGGNPGRFRTGGTELRLDERWRRDLPARSARTVSLLTWPLRSRYGYRGTR